MSPTLRSAFRALVLLLLCGATQAHAQSDAEKLRLIETYAPRVWLAEGEAYMPSSVEWAFQHLTRVKRDGRYWLYTKQEMSSPSDWTLPLFKGNLDTAPVYAFWVDKCSELERQLIKQIWPFVRR